MEIGNRIRQTRGKQSRKNFAQSIGIVENTLRNYEEGFSLPNSDVISEICRKHNVEATWLLMGTGAERGKEIATPTPQASGTACARCVELYAELVLAQKKIIQLQEQAQEQKETLLKENGEVKAEIAVLQQRLSPPATASGESAPAKTA